MTDPVALSSILGKFSEPRKPTVKYHHAELEAVVAMWKQRYGQPGPTERGNMKVRPIGTYLWAERILKVAEKLDVEPWVIVKSFPKMHPRIGWFAVLNWIKNNPPILQVGEVSFRRWQLQQKTP